VAGLTKDKARPLLDAAFASLLDPHEPVENLSRHYAETCVQEVDGVRMGYGEFLGHARALKQAIRSGRVTFDALVVEDPTVAAMYVVETHTISGETARLKVIAFITIEGGRIASLTELTHPVQA
jgi:ketosteroid isomerase-like protein